jgi:hypothetical protein
MDVVAVYLTWVVTLGNVCDLHQREIEGTVLYWWLPSGMLLWSAVNGPPKRSKSVMPGSSGEWMPT